MESMLQLEYPKRNRGRPKTGHEVMRPKFKIIQYDMEKVRIRTTQTNENINDAFANNEESKSVNEEHSKPIIFDGKTIYNRYTKEELISMISKEMNEEFKHTFILDKERIDAYY